MKMELSDYAKSLALELLNDINQTALGLSRGLSSLEVWYLLSF